MGKLIFRNEFERDYLRFPADSSVRGSRPSQGQPLMGQPLMGQPLMGQRWHRAKEYPGATFDDFRGRLNPDVRVLLEPPREADEKYPVHDRKPADAEGDAKRACAWEHEDQHTEQDR